MRRFIDFGTLFIAKKTPGQMTPRRFDVALVYPVGIVQIIKNKFDDFLGTIE